MKTPVLEPNVFRISNAETGIGIAICDTEAEATKAVKKYARSLPIVVDAFNTIGYEDEFCGKITVLVHFAPDPLPKA